MRLIESRGERPPGDPIRSVPADKARRWALTALSPQAISRWQSRRRASMAADDRGRNPLAAAVEINQMASNARSEGVSDDELAYRLEIYASSMVELLRRELAERTETTLVELVRVAHKSGAPGPDATLKTALENALWEMTNDHPEHIPLLAVVLEFDPESKAIYKLVDRGAPKHLRNPQRVFH